MSKKSQTIATYTVTLRLPKGISVDKGEELLCRVIIDMTTQGADWTSSDFIKIKTLKKEMIYE